MAYGPFLTGTNRGKGNLQVDDASNQAYGVDHIVFSGATLTNNGNGKITVTISGGGGGGMTSWTLAGASGASQTITNGNTATITGSGGITTVASATDTITISPTGVLQDLNTLGAASSDGEFIVATGAGAFAYESGATVRTSLGLGTIATQDANSVAITGGSITGITDLAIADGGTGQSTAQAAIDALTAVSGATTGHVLTKDGSGNATFQAASGGGISFNGSTANGIVTYGGATTADVESTLTFDSNTLSFVNNADVDMGLVFDNSVQDYYLGFDAGTDSFRIGTGTTIGGGVSFISADTSGNLTIGTSTTTTVGNATISPGGSGGVVVGGTGAISTTDGGISAGGATGRVSANAGLITGPQSTLAYQGVVNGSASIDLSSTPATHFYCAGGSAPELVGPLAVGNQIVIMREEALPTGDVVIDSSGVPAIGGAPIATITLREGTQASITLYSIDGATWNVIGESGTVEYA